MFQGQSTRSLWFTNVFFSSRKRFIYGLPVASINLLLSWFIVPVYNECMIYSLSGDLKSKSGRFVFIGMGGVTFKVMIPATSEDRLPKVGGQITIYTYMHVREGGVDLYGFLSEDELSFFESLVSVSGIGPKSAVSILSVAPVEQLIAAVSGGEVDLLQKSSGVGKKTAQRIILELKDKVVSVGGEKTVEVMQTDTDVYEALINLGYSRKSARDVLTEIDESLSGTADRLRDALKKIKN